MPRLDAGPFRVAAREFAEIRHGATLKSTDLVNEVLSLSRKAYRIVTTASRRRLGRSYQTSDVVEIGVLIAVIGILGVEGAVSHRIGIFFEGGYGIGLTGPDGKTDRLVARVGMRLTF